LEKKPGMAKEWKTNTRKKHYHRPPDEYNTATWKLDGAINDLQLLFRVGHRLAFDKKWPEWKTGSEFKAIRERNNGKISCLRPDL
jgi:hypothetical protein